MVVVEVVMVVEWDGEVLMNEDVILYTSDFNRQCYVYWYA